MAAFVARDITQYGLDLFAKGQTGKQIYFTRVVVGDGTIGPTQDPRTMTGLVNEVLSLDIISVKAPGDGQVEIRAAFSNDSLEVGFFYREIGVYALDPDSKREALYCYGNALDLAEWIPPAGGVSVIEKVVKLITVVGNATNIAAYIKSGVSLTPEDLEAHNRDPDAHQNANTYIATVKHHLGRYPACTVTKQEHALDVVGLDMGPLGASKMEEIPAKLIYDGLDTVEVYVPAAYAGCTTLIPGRENTWALIDEGSATSLLLILR